MYKNEKKCCRMSRRHCRSARHKARPSKLRPLEQRAAPRLPGRFHMIYIPQHMRSMSCHEPNIIVTALVAGRDQVTMLSRTMSGPRLH